MVQVSSNEIGRALYQLLKPGDQKQQPEDDLPLAERHTEIRRIIRQYPDGSIEIQEHEITNQRVY